MDIVDIPPNSRIGFRARKRRNAQVLRDEFAIFIELVPVFFISDYDQCRKHMILRSLVDNSVLDFSSLVQEIIFPFGRDEVVHKLQLLGCKCLKFLISSVSKIEIHERISIECMRLNHSPRTSFLPVVLIMERFPNCLDFIRNIRLRFPTLADIIYTRWLFHIKIHKHLVRKMVQKEK